jgi:molybdate transport system ATP-binding protein
MLEATIAKRLRDFPLELSFRVAPGEIVVLMGTNGAGKSTTLNIIAGLLPPDSGRVVLGGCTVFDPAQGIDVAAEDRGIGYVFQNSAVFPHLTVRENIAFGLRAHHLPRHLVRERVDHFLDLLDITGLSSVKAGNISGGQKQRVALARALATGPALLMLDEPFTALDAESDRGVKTALKKIVADAQIPCVVVTHRHTDVLDIADRVCVICAGKLAWEGLPADMPENIEACRCGQKPGGTAPGCR